MNERPWADAACQWVQEHQDRWLRQAIVPALHSATTGTALVVELTGPAWRARTELRPDLAAEDVRGHLDDWLRESVPPVSDLSRRWDRQWDRCGPEAHRLKHAYPERWVRFHSLPESKRYPGTEDEYAIALHRYNAVLDELFAGEEVYVITMRWREDPEPGTGHWTTICVDPDLDYLSYWHLYAKRIPWTNGAIDTLLREVADDAEANVMITDLDLRRIHHPYDGGADVLLPTTDERDALRARHPDWLGSQEGGYSSGFGGRTCLRSVGSAAPTRP